MANTARWRLTCSKEMTKIPLTKECEAYIQERLANGNSLSRAILEAFPISRGHVHLIAPSAKPHTSFYQGGVTSRAASTGELAEIVRNYVKEPDGCAILENTLAKPTDPIIAKSKAQLAIFRNEVYHALPSGDYPTEVVEDFIRLPRYSVALTGFLTRFKWPEHDRVELTEYDLKVIVKQTQSIIISVFDDEGFIIWQTT
jgi:hypothetical protein